MIGRYGVDDLSRAQIIVSMVLLLVSTFLSAFFRVNILYWLGLALLIYSYFRILSRNVSKRYEENQRYLNAKYRAVVKKNNLKKRWAQRSTYRFFKCPQCKQTVRVPKGRGKICITCPKCKTEFIKKSWQRRKALCLDPIHDCECGGKIENKKAVFCPKCKSHNVEFKSKIFS